MKEIVVHTQAELDALPDSFKDLTLIQIHSEAGIRIVVNKAWDNSSVVARDNSSVVAWDNSSVEAWDNSSAVARDNSSVEARGCVSVHLQSDFATVALFAFAVCFALAKGKITRKSKTSTVIHPKTRRGVIGWLDANGVQDARSIIFFKKVSKDFKTQEGTSRETHWQVGSTMEHPEWDPKSDECGAGKFHACSRPYFCDEFRNGNPADRYVAVEIAKKDLYAWPNPSYPHKIAFRRGTVLYECDRLGKPIKELK